MKKSRREENKKKKKARERKSEREREKERDRERQTDRQKREIEKKIKNDRDRVRKVKFSMPSLLNFFFIRRVLRTKTPGKGRKQLVLVFFFPVVDILIERILLLQKCLSVYDLCFFVVFSAPQNVMIVIIPLTIVRDRQTDR